MPRISRRQLLGGAAAAVAASCLHLPRAWGGNRPTPANRLTMGVIGTNGQGMSNLKALLGFPEVQMLAVCDVDSNHRQTAQTTVDRWYSRNGGGQANCAGYSDFRELLARKDIDAVVIATPDHWHALMVIAAAQAGKDIYGEKPLSLTIGQGRAMVQAVERHGVVFQTGSQQRSMQRFRKACELVRNGRLGKLHTVTCGLPPGTAMGLAPAMPVPEGFDYDRWLGPAPFAPYTDKRCHWAFRYNLDYSGGTVTDWGAHHFDIAQWAMGTENTGPVAVQGKGEFPKDGLYNVATLFHMEYEYASGVKVLGTTAAERGVRFEGSEGWVFVSRERMDANPISLLDENIGPGETHLPRSVDHHADFLTAVRRRSQPIAPIEQAHRSATVCHLGNIAMLLGRKVQWDPQRERFVNDAEADRMIHRAMREPWTL